MLPPASGEKGSHCPVEIGLRLATTAALKPSRWTKTTTALPSRSRPGAGRVPRDRPRQYRALPAPPRIQSVRRPPALDGRATGAGPPLVPQHHQVSGVAQLPAHDPGPDDRAGAAAGALAGRVGPLDRGLRPGALLLLCPPHPPDPRAGAAGVRPAGGQGESLALRQPSDGQPCQKSAEQSGHGAFPAPVAMRPVTSSPVNPAARAEEAASSVTVTRTTRASVFAAGSSASTV